MFQKRSPLVLLALLALLLVVSSTSVLGQEKTLAPVLGTDSPNVIANQYIVVLDQSVNLSAAASLRNAVELRGGNILQVYTSALNGFAATLPEKALRAVQEYPGVAYIEQDQVMTASVDWGLDRSDQHNLPLDNSYSPRDSLTGVGVHAYIIDTGMRLTHTEFTGRVGNGFDAIDGGTADDCNGHGTHVAGTVGGTVYGMAPSVTLHPVRVLNCSGSGSNSQVISGVDWVTSNHSNPAVANMSLGGGASSALDSAVSNSISSGVIYAVAAGNSNANACNYSPARVATALTVGATTSSDARASYSNYGTCLDLFAPGSNITSAWNTSDTATNTISGTSMASPHVAGAVALLLQLKPNATPADADRIAQNYSTSGVVSGVGSGSPNLLLYVSVRDWMAMLEAAGE